MEIEGIARLTGRALASYGPFLGSCNRLVKAISIASPVLFPPVRAIRPRYGGALVQGPYPYKRAQRDHSHHRRTWQVNVRYTSWLRRHGEHDPPQLAKGTTTENTTRLRWHQKLAQLSECCKECCKVRESSRRAGVRVCVRLCLGERPCPSQPAVWLSR